ncbi:MAG TPA: HEAT repeat domain-containing protein [Sedimentisphaerales bacterium]|nr:HEAT repeat domain-containing protein [Sedimentisphaerales bacterium]
MSQRSKVISVVLLAASCLLLLADILPAAPPEQPTKEELQKIEDAAPAKATVQPKQPRKLLVFNLCNDFKHSSIPYWDKALQIMGKKTGAYDVVFSNRMAMFAPEMLNQYDAVCLNNTTKLDFSNEKLREGLMNFVRGGKGLIGIHAASDNFYDWPEGAEMIGAQFSGHPWTSGGTWAIKIDDPQHPLTAAFGGKGFKINDELYRTRPPLYSRSKQRVLLSLDMSDDATRNVKGFEPNDVDTGISWVKSWGKGRVFYCSLGHNHPVVWTPAVLQHYLDGIQFALGDLPADTTPRLGRPLDEILADIAGYEYGQSRLPLAEVDDLIRSASDSPEKLKEMEKSFVEFLKSGATPAGKQFICRKLSVIGTKDSVPTLAAMLTEKATSPIEPADMARYALERIPGPEAGQALQDALEKTSGKAKIGIINSLGARGDRKAVQQLSPLISDGDKQVAEAALSALGKIGGRQAAKALSEAKATVAPELKPVWADAYLMCADKFLARGRTKPALVIYGQLYVPQESAAVRIAAMRGLVKSEPDKATETIVAVLKGDNQMLQAAAVGLVPDIPGEGIVKAVTAELGNLSVMGQVQVLSALGTRGDRSALPAVLAAAKSSDTDVRIAACGAIADLGDASNVDLLAQQAASTEGAEQQAARNSLYRLRGPKVDEKILAGINEAEPKLKVELIRAAGERDITAAVELLLKTAWDRQAEVRLESIKVLKTIADEKDLPALVSLVVYAKTEADRTEAENTVAAVARKIEDRQRRADVVLKVLASTKEAPARCSLISVLGKIGSDSALPVLRQALKDEDATVRYAAIRVLSDWPNAEPMNDLLEVARAAGEERNRVLALRGYIRMIGMGGDRPAADTVKMYRSAMELASDAASRRSVLSGLANVRSLESLQLAAGYLEDSDLQAEAEAAVVRIAESTKADHPQQTKEVLQKILSVSKNDGLRERAQKLIDQINQ